MLVDFLLIALIVICVITDLRERKIYNKVLLPFLLAGLVLNSVTGGIAGLTSALAGTAVGFSILLIPYLLGGMGAGDVKLLAVVGGLKGAVFVLTAAVYMALAGGIIALIILFFRKGAINRLKQIGMFLGGLRSGMKVPLGLDKEALNTTYPYGVAIAIGALAAIVFPAGGGLL
ncbi:prepilin peptidase [Mesobacillus jeotgali]|uniref:A24 family peptidase n=1 Tax=Mesobacillus jeotgali TaxID=129985 RepID=UPI0017851CCB|nr:prepilin peptidase [Mesobacillus jeotgali]UYZ21249.1 prepilin peptidase [Mesobacillus jeotgali]